MLQCVLNLDFYQPFLTAWTWGGAEPEILNDKLFGLSGIFTILQEKRPVRAVHFRWYVCVCVYVSAPSLLRLGSDQQSQGAPDTKGLADHDFHLCDGSEEQQVLIDGVNLPTNLQAGHLGGTDTQTQWITPYFCI